MWYFRLDVDGLDIGLDSSVVEHLISDAGVLGLISQSNHIFPLV